MSKREFSSPTSAIALPNGKLARTNTIKNNKENLKKFSLNRKARVTVTDTPYLPPQTPNVFL